jgi:predicted RNase H-like nuclease
MNILGIDIGFSQTRKSTGIAGLENGSLSLAKAFHTWESRKDILGSKAIQLAAIDGPLLPVLDWQYRSCEKILSLGKFQRRCKPGLSHIPGTGRKLCRAAHETARQLMDLTTAEEIQTYFPRAWPGRNIIEAFPNAFLALSLADNCFAEVSQIPRNKKLDWLYCRFLQEDKFAMLLELIEWQEPNPILACLRNNQDRDERAALICLLMAAAVIKGKYTAVGDQKGGYIFLPPWELWAKWARTELTEQKSRVINLEIWKDGQCLANPG